jgi:hypothetical protein
MVEATRTPDHAGLAAEARQLAAEIVGARRALVPGAPCDRALVARLSRWYDRLDDIAAVLGSMTVLEIYNAVADADRCGGAAPATDLPHIIQR